MTNQEINRRLAFAIGYPPNRVRISDDRVQVFNGFDCPDGPIDWSGWQRFDHTDPAVIWRIAERFCLFPKRLFSSVYNYNYWKIYEVRKESDKIIVIEAKHQHAASATALAVIQYIEAKK